MNNRILDVNGLGRPMLQSVLKIAIHQHRGCYGDGERDWDSQESRDRHKFSSWMKHPTKGLILGWHASNGLIELPTSLGPEGILPIVWEYLQSNEAEACLQAAAAAEDKRGHDKFRDGPKTTSWSRNYRDGDVETTAGWQVYTEDWGHVGNNHYAICAVRKAYLWYGK